MRVAKELVAVNHLIECLELYGYHVSMHHTHFDIPEVLDGTDHEVKAMTVLDIADEDIMQIYRGFALCSVNDTFSKVRGAQLAFTRALEALSEQLGREDMKEMLS